MLGNSRVIVFVPMMKIDLCDKFYHWDITHRDFFLFMCFLQMSSMRSLYIFRITDETLSIRTTKCGIKTKEELQIYAISSGMFKYDFF